MVLHPMGLRGQEGGPGTPGEPPGPWETSSLVETGLTNKHPAPSGEEPEEQGLLPQPSWDS